MFDNRTIGIFDSGLGGLTVAAALSTEIPGESLTYLGDTARVPYGNKSAEVVKSYAYHCANFLQQENVKMIVVACNTASAYGLEHLRAHFDIPVVGVVQAGAELALATTATKNIGVIGTRATIQSKRYEEVLKELDEESKCRSVACPLLVPLAEEGMVEHHLTDALIKEYLDGFNSFSLDTLILGCTHYPLFQERISSIVGEDVNVINSAQAVAKLVKETLAAKNICSDSQEQQHHFYVTDSAEEFARVGKRFWGSELQHITHIDLQTSKVNS